MDVFEKALDSSQRRCYYECRYQSSKLLKGLRQLLNVCTALTLAHDWNVAVFRERFRNILNQCLFVRNIHYFNFQKDCYYQAAWNPSPNVFSVNDATVLFYRRTCGTIDIVQNYAIRQKLKCQGKLIVKCLGRFSFIYIQLDPDQVLIEDDLDGKRGELIQKIFEVYEATQRSSIIKIVTSIYDCHSYLFKNIFKQLISKKTPQNAVIDIGGICIQNDPQLSILLTKVYLSSLEEHALYQQAFFRRNNRSEGLLQVIFKDQQLIFANNLPASLKSLSLLLSVTPQSLLTRLQGQPLLPDAPTQSMRIYSTEDSRNIRLDKRLNAVFFNMKFNRSQRRCTINDSSVLQGLSSQKIQQTIGNEFLPTRTRIRRSTSRKCTMKGSAKLSVINNQKFLQIQFNTEFDINKVVQKQFNILEHDINTTCNMIKGLLKYRFPQMDFDDSKLNNFLSKVGYQYQKFNNPFHNIHHAFTVMHGAFNLTNNDKFKQLFNEHYAFSFVISGLCHDLGHTGFTNLYEEKTQSKLANRYGDQSILERHSICKALKLLTNEQTNFIHKMENLDWKTMRRLLVQCILATDNKNHKMVLDDFDDITADVKHELNLDEECKVLGTLLHCCDFWGNVKQYEVSKAWAVRINQQFSKQFKSQTENNLQVTPYFKDLHIPKVIAKNETVFISIIVLPLYKKINTWLDGYLEHCLRNLDNNIAIWKKVEQPH